MTPEHLVVVLLASLVQVPVATREPVSRTGINEANLHRHYCERVRILGAIGLGLGMASQNFCRPAMADVLMGAKPRSSTWMKRLSRAPL